MNKTQTKKTVKIPKRTTRSHKKPNAKFLKVYWPYIPLFVLVFLGLTFGYNWQPSKGSAIHNGGVLAYSTEIGSDALNSSTNNQRSQNGGLSALTINSFLTAAAQSKANDMVSRNYWSHNTPDGKEPWTFMESAGYAYQKAGENLAYGFATSNDTVIGWMNSPGHRANILDTAFKEVGFGYANSNDFVSNGQQTVVVAMYGNPSGNQQQASTPASTPPPPAATTPAVKKAASAPPPAPAAPPIIKQDTVVAPTQDKPPDPPKKIGADRINQAINSDNPVPAAQPAKNITKLQSITGGKAPWSAAALSIGVVGITLLWALKHAFIVKRVLIDGEQFVLHHPIIDVSVLAIVSVAILLSQSSGVIK